MTGEAELESEFNHDPDAEADSPTEAGDEDLTAHLRDLKDGTGCTEIWPHLSESHEEQHPAVCPRSRAVRGVNLTSRGDVLKPERITDSQMTNDKRRRAAEVPADRRGPVGEPVVRGDPTVTGDRTREVVSFDPTDPDSPAEVARTICSFSELIAGDDDHVFMFRGAAACAALVCNVGSYRHTAERADGDVSVSLIRKWARVHDLLQSIRRHIARDRIAPTVVKRIAHVSSDARLHLAQTTFDAGLAAREVHRLASEVNDGTPVMDVLADHGVDTGRLDVTLSADVYLELRCYASLKDTPPGDVVADVLDDYLG